MHPRSTSYTQAQLPVPYVMIRQGKKRNRVNLQMEYSWPCYFIPCELKSPQSYIYIEMFTIAKYGRLCKTAYIETSSSSSSRAM